MDMNYRQMQGMIRFHRSAEMAFRAVGNNRDAESAKGRREALEKQAHALELDCFIFVCDYAGVDAEMIRFGIEDKNMDEGALTFAVEAYLSAFPEG